MVDDVEPGALDLDDVGADGRQRPSVGAAGSVSRVARRRAWSQPCAMSPEPPSGGCAQSPIAKTRGSASVARSSPTTIAARHVQARPLRELDLGHRARGQDEQVGGDRLARPRAAHR